MINRQMQTAEIFQNEDEFDKFGTKTGCEYKHIKNIKAVCMLYSQSNTEDARFKDVTHVAYTTDKTLSDDMQIKFADTIYKVRLVNNDGRRMAVLYLSEVRT